MIPKRWKEPYFSLKSEEGKKTLLDPELIPEATCDLQRKSLW